MVGIAQRSTEHGHDGITDKLNHNPAMVINDLRHVVEVAAQQEQTVFGLHAFHDARETGNVREEERDLALLNARLRIDARVQQQLHHGPRHVLAPGLDRLLHVVKDALDLPDLRGAAALGQPLLFRETGELQLHDALHLLRQGPQGLQQAAREEGQVLREQHYPQQDDDNHQDGRQDGHEGLVPHHALPVQHSHRVRPPVKIFSRNVGIGQVRQTEKNKIRPAVGRAAELLVDVLEPAAPRPGSGAVLVVCSAALASPRELVAVDPPAEVQVHHISRLVRTPCALHPDLHVPLDSERDRVASVVVVALPHLRVDVLQPQRCRVIMDGGLDQRQHQKHQENAQGNLHPHVL
mmetsp:Transcript_20376/g.59102  ORF Transcript_20376/g.59102 Transcript_20376/m.59102 type:complete len:350 (+) Transcript_20376:515-1564(+)